MLDEIKLSSSLGRLEAVQRMHSCKRRHSTRQGYLPSFKLDTGFHCSRHSPARPCQSKSDKQLQRSRKTAPDVRRDDLMARHRRSDYLIIATTANHTRFTEANGST